MKAHKVLFVPMALLMVVSVVVAGCAPPAPPAGPETVVVKETVIVAGTPEVVEKVVTATPEPEVEEPEEEIFVAMVQHSSIPFTEQMRRGGEAAAEDFGVKWDYAAPREIDPTDAMAMFESMVTKGAHGIVLNPAPPGAWTTTIKEAVEKGVPVATIDNLAEEGSGASAYFSPHNFNNAKALALELFNQLEKQGITEGQIVFAICAPGYTGQEQRADGWEAACEENPQWECIGPLDSTHSPETNYAFWENAIVQYPDAVAFAGNCAFAGPNLGKIKKLNEADFGIATFDLEPETLEFLADGTLTVAMGANPYLSAYLAVRSLVEYLRGDAPMVMGWVDTGPELVTADNVEQWLEFEEDPEAKHAYFKELSETKFVNLNLLVQDFPWGD